MTVTSVKSSLNIFGSLLGWLVSGILALSLGWLLFNFTKYAMNSTPAFDGALNLNTAASFIRGTGYGFNYDSFFAFPAQTDGPFILPAALAFWLGGITPLTTQIVNLIYVGAFFVLLYLLFRRLASPRWLALLGVVVCSATPGFDTYAMNGFGEVIVLVWLMAGLLAATPAFETSTPKPFRFFAAGLLFGVAYLTKVIALICVAPAIVLLIAFPLASMGRVQRCWLLGFGVALPLVSWETFRYIELGSASAYLQWWALQIGQIRAQSGANAGPRGLLSSFHKGIVHLDLLASMTGVPTFLLLCFIVLPIGVSGLIVFNTRRGLSERILIGTLALVTMLYFSWWLLISPTTMAWLRRIINGLILQQALIVALIAVLITPRFAAGANRYFVGAGVRGAMIFSLLPAVLAQVSLLREGQVITRPPQPPTYAAELLRAAAAMQALPPDARIFGTGWWQAPVLSLFSQRPILNLQHWDAASVNALPRKYLVTDAEAQGLAESEIKEVLALAQYRTVIQSQGGSIYEIIKQERYQPFAKDDWQINNLSSGLDFSHGDYVHKRGIYSLEGKQAWSRPDSAVMLKRSDQRQLSINVDIPAQISGSLKSGGLLLNVSSAGCLNSDVPVRAGHKELITLPLECPSLAEPAPMLISFHFNEHVRFVHQLDADNRLLGFLLRSVQLH